MSEREEPEKISDLTLIVDSDEQEGVVILRRFASGVAICVSDRSGADAELTLNTEQAQQVMRWLQDSSE